MILSSWQCPNSYARKYTSYLRRLRFLRRKGLQGRASTEQMTAPLGPSHETALLRAYRHFAQSVPYSQAVNSLHARAAERMALFFVL